MKVLLILANGFNEIEASSVVEVLKAGGLDVVTAGMPGGQVIGSHGLSVMTQNRLSDVKLDEFSAVIFPGGDAVNIGQLSSSVTVQGLLNKFLNQKKWIAGINTAPMIFLKYGLIVEGMKTATHPSIEKKFPSPRPGPVVVDKGFITAPDTASSIEFSLKILETLAGDAVSRRVKAQYISKLPTRRMM